MPRKRWRAGRAGLVGALAGLALLAAGCGGSASGGKGTATGSDPSLTQVAAQVSLKPCGNRIKPQGLRCGSIEVPKFRSAPEKGNLEIGFAVRPRDDRSSRSRGAIFAVEGGPGDGA